MEKLHDYTTVEMAERVVRSMQPAPRVSVIVPARNEAQNLQYVLPQLPELVDEVVLVDGHSTDDTIEVAKKLLPSVKIVHQTSKGKGGALREGIAACTGDIIVLMDADGSTHPEEIPLFVDALLQGHDFAKGSRFMKDGGSHDITVLRRIGNYALCQLVNVLFWTRFSDLCYGYNAFWKHCLETVEIDCDGFEVETLINLRMHKAKFKIAEIPSFEYPRRHGESNLNSVRDGLRILNTIIKELGKPSRRAKMTYQHLNARPLAELKDPEVSVVICAYTEKRLNDLLEAIDSVKRQSVQAHEIIVVIDHNPDLLKQVKERVSDVLIVENHEQAGLSGARNTGVALAQSPLIAFLDDDAVAAPNWLYSLRATFADANVLGVGGIAAPLWQGEKPGWLPEEFYWVVGCSYRGLPRSLRRIRNPIGANMAFRREVFEMVGGFRHDVGRVVNRPSGCEETELCIRAGQQYPYGIFLHQPQAHVLHRVPENRTNWSYFRQRCFAEGVSKAVMSKYVGTDDSLASEYRYTCQILPMGILRGLFDGIFKFDGQGFVRAGTILSGLVITACGYGVGSLQNLVSGKKQSSDAAAKDTPRAARGGHKLK